MSNYKHSDFIHLRFHSAYSLAEGAIKIKEIIPIALNERMPAIGICDSGNLFGSLEFSVECVKNGIQPIIGCQLSLSPSSEYEYSGKKDIIYDQIVLICKNQVGYKNLVKLVTQSFLDTPIGMEAHVNLNDIFKYSNGLIVLTGGYQGSVDRLLLQGKFDEAEKFLLELKKYFGDSLYIEIQRHGLDVQKKIEKSLLDLAYSNTIPIVATNEAYFLNKKMFEAHDALLCIGEKKLLSDKDRRRVTLNHSFKTSKEMINVFQDLPEAIENTLNIAKRCNMIVECSEPILPKLPNQSGLSEEQLLRNVSVKGLNDKFKKYEYFNNDNIKSEYSKRLNFELEIIEKMGFAGYFLIVSDFIQWAKSQNIPVGPGRGSGAGSLVAWVILITDLDPIKYGLLFERFLNPERVSMPDFDIDFCQDRRDEVISYVQSKYGNDRVAQIITFGKLQARAAVRYIGKVIDMPLGLVDKLAKMIPNNPAKPVDLKQALREDKELKDLYKNDESIKQLFDLAQKVEGLYTHASTHAAGLVISDKELTDVLALYRDPSSDMPLTQFDMKWSEKAGLVKFDFLGLKTLTVIDKAIKLLEKRNIHIDISNISLSDKRTFELLCKGETGGVFQLESSGMRDSLRKLKPDVFEDIIAMVALYRPGPMDNIPSFIERKHGREEIYYLHNVLEPYLKETYGIMIYQEQVMQAAQVISGYSLADADILRRAMGKKLPEEMDAQEEKFISGAIARNTTREKAQKIFKDMAVFAGYGFNKSHAAAYGLIAYQTAFLKANYPVEFFAAIMSLDLQDTDKLSTFRSELTRSGILLLPPDINKSNSEFSVERTEKNTLAIRYALSAIKNVGTGIIKTICNEREMNGVYKDIYDFANRLDPSNFNKRTLENLSKAGALDSLNKNRSKLFHNSEKIIKFAQTCHDDKKSGQGGLFSKKHFNIDEFDDWDMSEKLNCELDAVGFYLSSHPLDAYSDILEIMKITKSSDLDYDNIHRIPNSISMVGSVTKISERINKNNKKFAIVTLSDSGGTFEIFVYEEVLLRSRSYLDPGSIVLCKINISKGLDQLRMSAGSIAPFDTSNGFQTKSIKILIDSEDAILPLKDILIADKKGEKIVTLVVKKDNRQVEVELPDKFTLTLRTLSAITKTAGVVSLSSLK
ncbi:MAG: DNA polymerase III subunit alpha [Alphaproteobacteria bacterium TMED87]|nr:DNA polymerase III subunit alpha [Rhodospirillaceae bacterium]OUV09598.1 MAG: DNA polymerase III subunit alpha [Alphaproteobacteria bacterium TMED87]